MTTTTCPLVSVVIPAVRDDADLRTAIDSVLDDGYPNLEVIVVWDGREDARPNLRPEVTVVVTGGVGTPGANNAGLDTASGAFVARLDADDVSLPGRFTAQVRELEATPTATICATNAVVIDHNGAPQGLYPSVAATDLPAALLRGNPLLHSSLMFRRSELRYDPRCVRMQDYELVLRASFVGTIAVVTAPYVQYRVHPAQTGRQVADFWRYIPIILRRRSALARHLGRSSGSQSVRNVLWFVAQYLNRLGLRDRYKRLHSSFLDPVPQGLDAEPTL